MYDSSKHKELCPIENWMIDLLEDDRPADAACRERVTQGLHWMYRAALAKPN